MYSSIQHVYKQLNEPKGMLYAWFPSMHTRVDIVLCQSQSEDELLAVVDEIYNELQQLEKTASYYDPTSELYHINRVASRHPIPISEELYTLIQICREYHGRTLGCFDITIQSDNYNQETHHSLSVSTEEHCIFYKQTGIRIDLSGMLKGYALEKIRTILHKQHIEDALINMGNSSILALGNHPHGKGWKVSFGTQASETSATRSAMINGMDGMLLHNQCLTTSGNETNERKHIVCPFSGTLIEGVKRLAVITDSGTEGEILSTALFVANAAQRKALIREFRITNLYDL